MRINHPSERSLAGSHFDSPGRFIATGQRCYCISDSQANTTDQRATATDSARAVSGSNNLQATDGGRASRIANSRESAIASENSVAIRGNISSGNLRAEKGAIVNVGLQGADLSALVDKFTTANTDAIAALATANAPAPAGSPSTPPASSSAAPDAAAGDAPVGWWAGKTDEEKKTIKTNVGIALALAGLWYFGRKSL